MMLLAGDVGATKTRLGIFSPERGPRLPLAEATFMSRRYPDMETLIGEFLAQTGLTVGRACFGVAGPVVGGTAGFINLPWVVDERQLCAAIGLSSVILLNDLTATAHAIPLLETGELHTINQGQPVQKGNMAVIAPGTGLGEAFITWDGSRYRGHASEGGHADFAPNDHLEFELFLDLQEQFGHVDRKSVV